MNDEAEHLPLEIPYSVRVRWQIWESLVTMLRVYANAASLNGEEYSVTSLYDAAWVSHRGCHLSLWFNPRGGLSSLRLKEPGRETEGRFHILQDGSLRIKGVEKSLDDAAIEWLEQLARAAQRSIKIGMRGKRPLQRGRKRKAPVRKPLYLAKGYGPIHVVE